MEGALQNTISKIYASSNELDKIKIIVQFLRANDDHADALADLRRGNSAFKTMDLVNVLLCQAARTRRAAMPPVGLHIRTAGHNGVTAARLKVS